MKKMNTEQKADFGIPSKTLKKAHLRDLAEKESFLHCFLKTASPLPLYALNNSMFAPPPPPPAPPPPPPPPAPPPP
ncbi:MAG: hypothetical protein FWG98_12565, partial [Candidatus Cloacimonetes bacterium]|nr:hypothetical protein [Candidatus Cloacimonadota bacterium]